MSIKIPVFEPSIDALDISSVVEAMQRGEISGSFGKALSNFEDNFAKYCESTYGIAVSSGTTALHLAISALDIGPGDEVLVSACTNIASALAIYHNGAVAVPVDSEEETWNLDIDKIESLITSRTKAIMPVHIYGHPVDMPRLMQISKRYNLKVIEDCAEAHGAICHGKKIGSFGDMNCFSFYANKIITTGEGGMILTNNSQLAKRLQSLRNLAFTQPRFMHFEAGYNFRMTGMQAALGLSQLKKIEQFIERKRQIAACYHHYLKEIEELTLPTEKSWARNVYWMYGVVLRNQQYLRDDLLQFLRTKGIDTRTFFCPLNIQPCLQKQKGFRHIDCPVAEKLWKQGFYLPSSYNLVEEQIAFIAQTIKEFITSHLPLSITC